MIITEHTILFFWDCEAKKMYSSGCKISADAKANICLKNEYKLSAEATVCTPLAGNVYANTYTENSLILQKLCIFKITIFQSKAFSFSGNNLILCMWQNWSQIFSNVV